MVQKLSKTVDFLSSEVETNRCFCSSGIPKSKSHFSKLKKAYNETTSKVSTVVQQGLRGGSENQRGVGVIAEINAHKVTFQNGLFWKF